MACRELVISALTAQARLFPQHHARLVLVEDWRAIRLNRTNHLLPRYWNITPGRPKNTTAMESLQVFTSCSWTSSLPRCRTKRLFRWRRKPDRNDSYASTPFGPGTPVDPIRRLRDSVA